MSADIIVNYSVCKGEILKDSFSVFDAITQADGTIVETPHNLTGYTAKGQVRKEFGTPVLAEFSIGNGRVVFSGADVNIVSMTILLESEIDTLDTCAFVYDFFLINAAGEGIKVRKGQILVSDSVTQ